VEYLQFKDASRVVENKLKLFLNGKKVVIFLPRSFRPKKVSYKKFIPLERKQIEFLINILLSAGIQNIQITSKNGWLHICIANDEYAINST